MSVLKNLISLLFIVLVSAFLAYQLPQYFSFLKFMEFWEDDARIATLLPNEPQHNDIIVVTVTEETLALFPYRSPIDRQFISDLLKKLESNGVQAIFLDFLFDQPTEPDKDQELKETIKNLKTPLVVSYGDNTHGINLNPQQQQYLDDFIPIDLRGLANIAKDSFGTVRWIYPGHRNQEGVYINGVVNTMAIKTGSFDKVSLNTLDRIAWHGTPDSDTMAFRSFPAHMVRVLPAAWFKDKIILIGSELSITDRHRTPFSLAPELNKTTTQTGTPGVFIHAHSLAHVLDQREYPSLDNQTQILIITLFAIIGSLLAHLKTRFFLNALLGILVLGGFWILAINYYSYSGILIAMSLPSLSMSFAFILTSLHITITTDIEKEVAIEETKVKSEFLANMSHEIRSPMNAIMGMTELVLESKIDNNQRKHLTTVLSSARALLNLINDILDLSKLESGKMQMEEATFDLRQLFQDTIATLSVQANAKGLEILLEIDNNLPPCFIGDPLRLRQVVMNLTNNAIKFTETGYIQINVSFDKQDSECLLVTVKDTGIGIPTNRQAAVFESFTQVDGSTSRKHGGTGLGTTISKQIVELMQGKIWLKSEEGKGSTFFFTVKIPEAVGITECKIEYGTALVDKSTLKRSLRVLLVDDIDENLQLCSIRLEQRKHRITQARDGLEALEAWQKNDFDIVLMDAQMPNMDGFEATRAIRKLETQQEREATPIIAMTANAMKGDREKCLAVGMDDYVSKPVDFNLLFSKIDKVVPDHAGIALEDEESTSPSYEETPPTVGGIWDSLYGVDSQNGLLVWGNEEVYKKSLFSFAHNHANDGRRIQEAWKNSDYDAAKSISHALKGVAANLSLPKLSQLSTELDSKLLESPQTVDQLINDLHDELLKVTSAINGLKGQTSDIGVETEKVVSFDINCLDNSQLEQFNALFDHLEAGDAQGAEKIIKQIREYQDNRIPEIYLDKLLHLIDDFDFFQAQELIVQLKERT